MPGTTRKKDGQRTWLRSVAGLSILLKLFIHLSLHFFICAKTVHRLIFFFHVMLFCHC